VKFTTGVAAEETEYNLAVTAKVPAVSTGVTHLRKDEVGVVPGAIGQGTLLMKTSIVLSRFVFTDTEGVNTRFDPVMFNIIPWVPPTGETEVKTGAARIRKGIVLVALDPETITSTIWSTFGVSNAGTVHVTAVPESKNSNIGQFVFPTLTDVWLVFAWKPLPRTVKISPLCPAIGEIPETATPAWWTNKKDADAVTLPKKSTKIGDPTPATPGGVVQFKLNVELVDTNEIMLHGDPPIVGFISAMVGSPDDIKSAVKLTTITTGSPVRCEDGMQFVTVGWVMYLNGNVELGCVNREINTFWGPGDGVVGARQVTEVLLPEMIVHEELPIVTVVSGVALKPCPERMISVTPVLRPPTGEMLSNVGAPTNSKLKLVVEVARERTSTYTLWTDGAKVVGVKHVNRFLGRESPATRAMLVQSWPPILAMMLPRISPKLEPEIVMRVAKFARPNELFTRVITGTFA
jgi:hypothetical protein